MKNKKLKLEELEVQSFVTSLGPESRSELKGGLEASTNLPTMPCNCSAIDACVTAWNCTNIPLVC